MSRINTKIYWRYKHTLSIISFILLAGYLLLAQVTGVSVKLASFSLAATGNFYFALALYLVVLCLLYDIVLLPLTFFETFILEHAFGLSNQTLKQWASDIIKKIVISMVIFLVLAAVFYSIAKNFHANWWIIAAVVWFLFSVFFTRVFPVVVIPLFYRYKSLQNNELREKTLAMAKSLAIKIMDVSEIDFSKDTKKSNAAIVGWGSTRRVILADNLLKEFTNQEIEVVLAHEMAHYKLGHLWLLILAGAASIALFFFILNCVMGKVASILGASSALDISVFPSIWLLFLLYGLITTPAQNAFSRRLEKDADTMALKITRSRESFISLMKKLAEKNLSDEKPNALVEIFFYDHPPVSKRIEAAEKLLLD